MGRNCRISESAVICEGVIIGDNVVIEDHVYLDVGVIVRSNVHIMEGTTVGARCILGEYLMDFYAQRINSVHPLVIGQNSLLRSDTIVYGDTVIGDGFQSGHRVTIRERTQIGRHVRIGTLSDVQGNCRIGDYVNIHSGVFVAPDAEIGNYSWLFPHVVLTNDPTPPSDDMAGVVIGEYAVVAARALLLPAVHIGNNSLVGAGAVVTKNVPDMTVVIGNPARQVGSVTRILNRFTGEPAYPWPYVFDRGMPWQGKPFDEWLRGTETGPE